MRCETEFMAATATGRFPEKCVLESRHQGAHVSEIGHVDPDADLDRCRKLLERCAEALEECREIIDSKELLGVFQYAGVHGYMYTGKSVDTKKLAALIAEADAAARGER